MKLCLQTPCNFDALPSLIVVCHGLLPLLAVPLTFELDPGRESPVSVSVVFVWRVGFAVATVASSAGLWVFQTFLAEWPFRRIFWISTLLQIGASFFDLILVRRWNETVLGVPDRLMYILGDAIIMPVCTMLNFMPSVVLTSKLCPKNMLVYRDPGHH